MLSLEIFKVYESKERVPPPHRPRESHEGRWSTGTSLSFHREALETLRDTAVRTRAKVLTAQAWAHNTHCPPRADYFTWLRRSPHL